MPTPPPDLDYLRKGTPRQRAAHAAIEALGLWQWLGAYGPVLAGTIPLAVDVPGSDLDVICQVPATARPHLRALLEAHCGHWPGFGWQELLVRGMPSVLCGFEAQGFAWEIFGQDQPAAAQYAVRHLRVEQRVLAAGGEAWRQAVQQLKRQGLKTEPAFAQLLHLPGDPYEALLTLEAWPDDQLRRYVLSQML